MFVSQPAYAAHVDTGRELDLAVDFDIVPAAMMMTTSDSLLGRPQWLS